MLLPTGLRGGLCRPGPCSLELGRGGCVWGGGGGNLLTDPSRASTSTSSEFAPPCGT